MWRLVGSPLSAGSIVERSLAELWNLIRGAAPIAAPPPSELGRKYVELLSEAYRFPAAAENYLSDNDGSFYVSGYLRSWAFEAQLREFLRGEFGNDWFTRREAGDLLRELWALGQGPTAEELLAEVTGARLEMAAVTERVREGLAL